MLSRSKQAPLKVLVGVGIVLAFLAVVIWVPKLSFIQPGGLTDPVDRAKAESDLRGHLLQALGGLVLILGAYFTARTLRLNQEGHRLNQEGQITERFTRAVEQLANDKLDIRLGGIYALERIAHDSETHYEPVMEVLTAFLREHALWPPSAAPVDEYSEPWEVPALRVDFQTVATVLGRRDRRHERNRLYLRGVYLRRASLDRADLTEVNLTEADLSWADLRETNLSWANLRGANLRGATLSRADLSGADLSGAKGLTQQQLDDVVTDEDTKLPEGFVLPARL